MAREPGHIGKRRAFFVNKNFAMIWIGGTIARLSEGIVYAAFGLWIFNSFGSSQSPNAVAFVTKAIVWIALLALFGVGPLAGVFVDRWADKRRVLLFTSALRAFIALIPIVITFLVKAPGLDLLAIYLATFLISMLTHFSVPVSYVLFADSVQEEDYSYANGLLLTTSYLATVVGVPVGIFLFSTVGFSGALLFDALLYATTFVATLYISVEISNTVAPREPFFRAFKEGVAFCVKTPLIAILLVVLILINIWNGVLTTLGDSFATQNLHAAAVVTPPYAAQGYYGIFGLAVGLSVTIGSFIFGLISRRLGEKRVFSYSLGFVGLFILVASRLTQFVPALVMICLVSVFTAGVNVTAVPLYLWVTPRRLLGRVRAIVDVVMNLSAVAFGGTALALSGSALRGLHIQISWFSLTPITLIFLVAGALCMVGRVFVSSGLARIDKAKSQQVLTPEPEPEPETAPEPVTSGRI